MTLLVSFVSRFAEAYGGEAAAQISPLVRALG